LTASRDGSVKVWEPTTARIAVKLREHTSAVNAAAFGPDSKLLVTAGDDGWALLFRCEVCGSILITKPSHRVRARPSTSATGQRTYDFAIRQFVAWLFGAPFNRTVVLRYRIHLEQRGYAPSTINLRFAAVPRVASEAADAGLLSPELVAGIRRVKGVRRIGVRLGNWLAPEQGRRLLDVRRRRRPVRRATTRWSQY
jgi:hypothetical protein